MMEFKNTCGDVVVEKDCVVGIANQGFTPEFMTGMGAAFGSTLKTTDIVLIGRDFRYDSRMLKRCFTAGLIATGISAFDFHAIPGSVLQFLIRRFGASAGVLFASSHSLRNGIEIRIFDDLGIELSKEQIQGFLTLLETPSGASIRRVPPEQIGHILVPPETENIYRTALTKVVNTKTISQMRSTVAVDCSLSPISQILPSLLSEMKFKVISLNSFQPVHLPEVLPNNLSLAMLTKSIIATDSDLGMVFGQQGSCVHFIDNSGNFIEPSEVATLLALERIQQAGAIEKVIVISEYLGERARKTIEDAGATVKTVDVTITSLPQVIRRYRAIFGATDDGSYYYPAFSPGRECILTSFYLLNILAKREQRFSQLVHPYAHQRTESTKKLSDLQEVLNRLGMMNFSEFKILDTIIGYKFIFPDGGWVHLRPTRMLGICRMIGQGGENSTEEDLFRNVNNTLETIQEQISQNKQENL
jgi:phosphomannomutase/phosphoglucomutase